MKPILKVAIVAAGYVLAILIAWAAVAVHAVLTNGPAAQASAGMSAFGDLVLFVLVFGAVSLVPTGAAVFFIFSRIVPQAAAEMTPTAVTSPAAPESRRP